jgi:hypothetical protein
LITKNIANIGGAIATKHLNNSTKKRIKKTKVKMERKIKRGERAIVSFPVHLYSQSDNSRKKEYAQYPRWIERIAMNSSPALPKKRKEDRVAGSLLIKM